MKAFPTTTPLTDPGRALRLANGFDVTTQTGTGDPLTIGTVATPATTPRNTLFDDLQVRLKEGSGIAGN